MNEKKKLSRLVDVKRRMRDVERAGLARARGAVDKARVHAENADRALQQAVDRLVVGGFIGASELSERAEEVRRADGRLGAARVDEANMEGEMEVQRHVLTRAHRGLRALESLEERVRREASERERRVEQEHADEVAARRVGGPT